MGLKCQKLRKFGVFDTFVVKFEKTDPSFFPKLLQCPGQWNFYNTNCSWFEQKLELTCQKLFFNICFFLRPIPTINFLYLLQRLLNTEISHCSKYLKNQHKMKTLFACFGSFCGNFLSLKVQISHYKACRGPSLSFEVFLSFFYPKSFCSSNLK